MSFDREMSIRTACFAVVNPLGTRSSLYGRRFIDGFVTPATPAIVLVHGAASSTEDWDLSPTWSVARALASAGYVVFSYDRLGFAKSGYFQVPAGGTTLTTAVQRRLLHQVVEAVKAGSYTATAKTTCPKSPKPSGLRSRNVILVGHSAGGWVVAGYPGEYPSVAAMIKADITATMPTPLAAGGAFTPDQAHPDYYQFFQTRKDCETFNAYPSGAVQYALAIACTPPFVLTPFGEIGGLAQTYVDDATYIPRIGRNTPVLLTSGEDDTTDPPSAARKDFAYYRLHCRCGVSQFIVPNTGHLFMAHRSLSKWIEHVVDWLSSRGLRPSVALSLAQAGKRRIPRGLTVRVLPEQLRQFPLRLRVSGSLGLWSGMSAAEWCTGGLIDVEIRTRTAKGLTHRTRVRHNCAFRALITIGNGAQLGPVAHLHLLVRFAGDDALRSTGAKSFSFPLPDA